MIDTVFVIMYRKSDSQRCFIACFCVRTLLPFYLIDDELLGRKNGSKRSDHRETDHRDQRLQRKNADNTRGIRTCFAGLARPDQRTRLYPERALESYKGPDGDHSTTTIESRDEIRHR